MTRAPCLLDGIYDYPPTGLSHSEADDEGPGASFATGAACGAPEPDIGETAMWRLLEGMTRAQAVILHELLMRSRKGLPS